MTPKQKPNKWVKSQPSAAGTPKSYAFRRHRRSGHLFQGRYKAILVDAGIYLMELIRYVVLNQVRAGMVDQPGKWPWSSYNAMVGETSVPRSSGNAIHNSAISRSYLFIFETYLFLSIKTQRI